MKKLEGKWIKVATIISICMIAILVKSTYMVFSENTKYLDYEVMRDQVNPIAYIVFDVHNAANEIESIKDPEGNLLDLQTARYTVEESGEYVFTIRYIEANETKEVTQAIAVDIVKRPQARALGRQLVPDENFYNYLISEKGLPTDFTQADLASVDYIDYMTSDPSLRINSIQGIEYMSNLTHVYLNDQNLSSLQPMKDTIYPKLTMLEFNNWNTGTNAIHDLSLLTKSRFPQLKGQIMFNNNGITDEHLTTLPTSDGIEKAQFHFQNNNISSLEIFRHYSDLKELHVQHNQIADLTPLSTLRNVEILQLSNNLIVDVSPLTTIQSISNASLYLNNNQIVDLSPLQSFTGSIYAQTYHPSIDPYHDPDQNYGQQIYLNEPIYGDKKTKTIKVYATGKNRDGNAIPFECEGNLVEEAEITLLDLDDTYTYTSSLIEYDTRYQSVTTQPIIWWDNPIITMDALEIFTDTNYDLLTGVEAIDTLGNSLTTKVSIHDRGSFKSDVPGTYEVQYKVVDERNYETIQTRIIKVHGQPILKMENQRFNVDDFSNININQHVNAYWMQAQDSPNQSAQKVAIEDKDLSYDIILGPDKQFQKVGIYKVKFTAKAGTVSKSKEVSILLSDASSVQDILSSVLIAADSIQINYQDINALNPSQLLQRSNANAFKIDKNTSDEILGFRNIKQSIKVHEKQYEQIKKCGPEGGVYPLIIYVNADGIEVSKEIMVVVYGTNTPKVEDEKLVITAKDFSLSEADAKTITDEQVNELAQAKALLLTNDEFIYDIRCNEEELKEIRKGKGGTYNLTFTAQHFEDEEYVSATTKVKVKVNANIYGKYQQKKNISSTLAKASVAAGDTTDISLYMQVLVVFGIFVLRKLKKKIF
ncbi:Leucine-rich repeat (LRR) protein [Breznakia sp. PF5-3]|uniref:leucine-rich repeat domain-containing protein n=1 Tax=unclassified Breznakia TaxID=2623764 RepID=UPI002406D75A|nr:MULTISPECIES: leucine-rich repeat domain-containing protein [unclassified Breznakia]MDF9824237.1 Leucine-rich repeat (LRR) protein [Breznakia sp. PM6-1]MDF9835035.1 Leucine-rich repeat (LRR) protein [Breznakia sp. PF5-3]MDF9837280.1 Leucine-rich repeat (LRR) protein [Breznakia sp. PFB2-8]MDF9859270.1 Leucine-rich repeat (LRR) protein [Breznakia sp. PH5-24]